MRDTFTRGNVMSCFGGTGGQHKALSAFAAPCLPGAQDELYVKAAEFGVAFSDPLQYFKSQ